MATGRQTVEAELSVGAAGGPAPEIPQDKLNGRLANGSQAWPIKARIGQGKGEKSDFWSAVGGQYKVSLDYVVRLSVESGAMRERGPEVRTQTIRTQMTDAPKATVLEMHRSGGKVCSPFGTTAGSRQAITLTRLSPKTSRAPT